MKEDAAPVHSQFRALLCVCKMYTEAAVAPKEIHFDTSSQRMRNSVCLTDFLSSSLLSPENDDV